MTGGTQVIRPLVLLHVVNERPSGAIDSSNMDYVTQYKYLIDSLTVYLNGLKLSPGISNDWVGTGPNTFSMNYAPTTGDIVEVEYRRQLNN